MQCNQPEHALKCLRRAQALEPNAVDIAYNLAHCFHQLGEPRQVLYGRSGILLSDSRLFITTR